MIGHRHYRLRELDRFTRDAGLEPELLELRGGAWQLLTILDLYVSKWLLAAHRCSRPPSTAATTPSSSARAATPTAS